MTYGERLALRIDAAFAADVATREDGFRHHLGASVIGESCQRKIWFAFRWCEKENFDGRMLRLFERGQLEEERFARYLRLIGATVYTHQDGKQFSVSYHGGHFSGSTDGVAVDLPEQSEPVLLEMKTHGEKSFEKLRALGVAEAKPMHFKQMQIYCDGLSLNRALYMAVNKNTDELYLELVDYDPAVARSLVDKAESVIFGTGLPPRISNSPSTHWECRFCAMRGVCLKDKEVRRNCRTCVHSRPERAGGWSCGIGREEITTAPKIGCQNYTVIPDLAV